MEDYSHEWFLTILEQKRAPIRILETVTCRGDKLIN